MQNNIQQKLHELIRYAQHLGLSMLDAGAEYNQNQIVYTLTLREYNYNVNHMGLEPPMYYPAGEAAKYQSTRQELMDQRGYDYHYAYKNMRAEADMYANMLGEPWQPPTPKVSKKEEEEVLNCVI